MLVVAAALEAGAGTIPQQASATAPQITGTQDFQGTPVLDSTADAAAAGARRCDAPDRQSTLFVDGDHPWQLDKRLRDAGPGPAHIRFAISKPV